ncbi:leucyl-cystinyl aminopeptidase isoform X1 [Triplophysa dalaica]|uniref:leucyl-cystinyl aminopeptidase isoform X1 n=1 Tax=Triplophysa dalaica TaxID=1582913 RepID=UPI0024DF5778|nr:leucyl-cystinyl aminopeptidase isoform X1 [Triplophysa dalaica]
MEPANVNQPEYGAIERAPLPRNMIENSMFEEEPDVVDLAKESPSNPIDSDDAVYEPRNSRLLVRGLGENDLDEDEEDYESSARLLGMSFMNRSSNQRCTSSPYTRQQPSGLCLMPSAKTLVVCVLLLVLVASMAMVIYFLPGCTFTRNGCKKNNSTMDNIYPNSTSGEPFPWTDLRLPGGVQPMHYDILLHPNLTTMNFRGNVSIRVQVTEETNKMVLHSSNMNIVKATFQGKEVKILEYKPWQQIAIKFPEDLQKGVYVLNIIYTANLSTSYDGFYNSSYVDTTGAKRVLATTQFEPLAARKAFPCFDEPAFKSTYIIKMTREPKYISLSNMPKAKTTDLKNGLLEDEFEKSVVMSTYLVAFVVAEFESVSKNFSKTTVSVYAVPDKKDQIHYALDTAGKLLEFYNTFFDIDYPLSKLDLVAIPDFLAGAMENWGLITFRENMLLVGNNSSPIDKQLVTSVIAHELAHQWFGNLVTMKWWNDLWLNEGFATYMQYTSIETIFTDLDMDTEFLSIRFKAMAKDALNSSHPVSSIVKTPEQVEEMFDSVSYEKGASILLMLNSTLTEEEFRKGVIEYLQAHRFQNTKSEDLWNSLTNVSKQPFSVAHMMNTWTVQKGFPLVTVTRNGTQVTLTQEHFLLNAEIAPTHDSSLWHIPLTYVNDSCSTLSSCKQVFYLKEKTATLKLPDQVKWLKFNYKSDGFYIVNYDDKGWEALIEALRNDIKVLTYKDRASLINNVFALSRLGKVPFRLVLNLMDYIKNETETAPLTEALIQLNQIFRLLDKRSELHLVSRMKSYILNYFGTLMEKQSWLPESSVSKMTLKSTLLEMACSLDISNCTQQAKHLYDEWMAPDSTYQIPSHLMRTVFKVAAQTEEGWGVLLGTYKNSISDPEKHKALEALASTQDVRKIVWILQKSLDGSMIPTPEFPLVVNAICKNFAGYLYAWDFVKENWDKITQKFPLGSFAIQSLIMSTTSQFSTTTHLMEAQNFFSSLGDKGSQMRTVQEAIETIKLNKRWIETNLETLQEWL